MDFNFSEEQTMIRDSLARLLRDQYDFDTRRKVAEGESGWRPQMWQQFAELGLLAAPFSEEDGGLGGSAIDSMVIMEEFGKALVDMLGPTFPPALDHLRAVPVALLLAKPVFIHLAHGEHDVGMGFGLSVLADVPMHIQIGNHALIDKFGLGKVAGEFDALCLRHLARDSKLDLARKLGIFPHLEGFDIVPQPFAVFPHIGCVLWQQHLGMDDAALVREVVAAFKPVVAQPRGRAVGGGRHRARPCLAANDLDVKMIDRHRDPNISTEKRTSERRISAPSK